MSHARDTQQQPRKMPPAEGQEPQPRNRMRFTTGQSTKKERRAFECIKRWFKQHVTQWFWTKTKKSKKKNYRKLTKKQKKKKKYSRKHNKKRNCKGACTEPTHERPTAPAHCSDMREGAAAANVVPNIDRGMETHHNDGDTTAGLKAENDDKKPGDAQNNPIGA